MNYLLEWLAKIKAFESLAIIASLFAIGSSIYYYLRTKPFPKIRRYIEEEYIALKTEFDTFKNLLTQDLINLDIKLLETTLPEKQALELEVFQERIEKLESGLLNFRKLLFEDPEASVTIPLIKKDIDSLRQENKNLREEFNRIVEYNKWFFRIVIAIALGIGGLAISIFLRG